ncbi:MAG: biotin/lipoyl-binding protein, partial [Acidobacteria bacterium]
MARTRRRTLVAVAGVVLALGCVGVGYTVLAKPATTIDPTRLAAVERGDLARSVVATGKIEPITKVEIKSKANGIIKDLKVEVGDAVVEGQVLAELDRDNLAARLREARAALAGAQANLKGAEAELAKNRIEAEGPQAVFAQRNLDRPQKLAAEKLI